MVQIIKENSLGGNLGNALSSGISTGLENLARMKLRQLEDRNQATKTTKALKALGYTPEQAEQLSGLDPNSLKYLVQQKVRAQERVHTSAPGLQTLVPELTPEDAAKISTLTPAIQLEFYKNYLQAPEGTIDQVLQGLGRANVSSPMNNLSGQQRNVQPSGMPQPPAEIQPFMPAEEPDALKQTAQMAPKSVVTSKTEAPKVEKPKTVAQLVKEGKALKVAKEEAKEARKEEHLLKKEIAKQQELSDKETLPYYEEVLKSEKAAHDGDLRLNRMEALIKKGNLPYSAFYNLFKNLEEKVSPTAGGAIGALIGGTLGSAGGPIGGVAGRTAGALAGTALGGAISPVAGLLRSVQRGTSPDTEEFEKLTADFVKSAKDFFPGRVTNTDLEAFFRMIPTLSNTDTGKEKIINNMRSFNEITKVRAKAMKDIIKQNGGNRPKNLQILVEEKVAPEVDRISKEFVIR